MATHTDRPRRGGTTAHACSRANELEVIRADRRFREQVRHLHRLGPRPIGEILGEVLSTCPGCRGLVLERLDYFGDLDPAVVDWLGAADWVDQRQLVRAVAGSEP